LRDREERGSDSKASIALIYNLEHRRDDGSCIGGYNLKLGSVEFGVAREALKFGPPELKIPTNGEPPRNRKDYLRLVQII
jgi:hypothetical protein